MIVITIFKEITSKFLVLSRRPCIIADRNSGHNFMRFIVFSNLSDNIYYHVYTLGLLSCKYG